MARFKRCLPFAFSFMLLLGPYTSKAEEMPQFIYWGSIGATVRAPTGWRYSTVNQAVHESQHVFALYSPNGVSTSKAQAYVTFIPAEIRHPESLEMEIGFDKETSKKDGLEFKKTDRYKTNSGEPVAINTYVGKSYSGFISSKLLTDPG